MRILLGALLLLWLLLMPPFFTHGACTAEFDAVQSSLDASRPQIATVDRARTWLSSQGLPFRELNATECKSTREKEVEVCTGGPLLLASVPVRNRVCHYYRDGSVRLQLGFNAALQLVRIQTDMDPDHSLQVFGYKLGWGT